jgi:hypothetical protein
MVPSTETLSYVTLLCGQSDDCTDVIGSGDLHAAFILNDVEVNGTYRTSMRICYPCVLSEHFVEDRQTVSQAGEPT